MQVSFFSDTLGMCVSMDVIIPQKAYSQIGIESREEDKYKTLYLLHGMSDDHTIWERRTSIERYASEKGLAVVMPTTQLGWYTDMECGYQRYFTYISEELPNICRSFFPKMSNKREDNFIAGLSMGGYGALKAALAKSEMFSKAACFSGAFDIEKYPESPYWNSIFGSGESRAKHSIRHYADLLVSENRKKPELFFWCGTEDSLLTCNRNTRDLLEHAGFSVDYRESTGSHTWHDWDEQIKNALDFFLG